MNAVKQLCRSTKNKVIGGVCGGLGEYFEIDPTIIRIIFIVSMFVFGTGFLAYFLALIILPKDYEILECKQYKTCETQQEIRETQKPKNSSIVAGLLLIGLGVVLLLNYFNIEFFNYFSFIDWKISLALFIIFYGAYLIYNSTQTTQNETEKEVFAEPKTDTFEYEEENGKKRLYRVTGKDKMFLGICAGCANYFKIDVSISRLAWAFFMMGSGGIGIIVYFVLAFTLPERD